jgi:hypothetical protein
MKKSLIMLILLVVAIAAGQRAEAQFTPQNLPTGSTVIGIEKTGYILLCPGTDCKLFFKYWIISMEQPGLDLTYGILYTDMWLTGDCTCADFATSDGTIVNNPPWEAMMLYVFTYDYEFQQTYSTTIPPCDNGLGIEQSTIQLMHYQCYYREEMVEWNDGFPTGSIVYRSCSESDEWCWDKYDIC